MARSLDDEDLVGVYENREKIEQWLADDDLGCSVIALLGMGGLGKTTLAANVYKKEREKFQCHAWISISQTFSREDVLRNIIKEIFKDKVSVQPNTAAMDITRLEETLKNFLEQQKYLIILDDVWTPEAFEDLSRVLVHNDKGSRLIITTREARVAALSSRGHILTLEALPEDKAWDLFCKKAFPRDTNHECPIELKHLSEEIVSKCKGLPLVIVLVGSLLRAREKTVEQWRIINVQLSWELINNSSLSDIRNVLHLSFIYLPTHLKICFLYCSLFPEDYLFKRKQLVRLWIAEGFVEERGASTLEEVAECYLKELIDRNMLQLVKRNHFGRMKEFRMHDILRELAVDLCQKNCFGVTYENKCGVSHQKNGRRLVLHKLKNDVQQPFSNMHQLRTVIALGDCKSSFTLLPLLCNESRYMTVLELSGLPIEKVPDAIGDLFNLRHLGLRDSNVKMLPKSVEKLSNLLTQLREDPLPFLSRLSSLTYLEFTRAYNGEQLAFLAGWFPKLKVLYLYDLSNLNRLDIQEGAMASLEKLYLVNLSSMTEVPRGVEFLMRLRYLAFHEITRDFLTLLHQWSPTPSQRYHYSLHD